MKILTVPKTRKLSDGSSERYLFCNKTAGLFEKNISLEERVTLSLTRDLIRLGWRLKSNSHKAFELAPPAMYDKNVVRNAMSYSRNEAIERKHAWIKEHIELGRANLALGENVLKSEIVPKIEVCETTEQHNIFRILRYFWSSPSSDYIGRRIRLLIRDDGIKGSPVIGIAALGSSIIHIPDRDKWIGWDTKTRSQRIIYMMDAYVIGALPPYNYLLGGKLISYIIASNEIRDYYMAKYKNFTTIINKRKANDLVLIVTTSLYGPKSSQYNRLKYEDSLLYEPIGITSGYGSIHISNETFNSMRQLAEENGCVISNQFGKGPNWRMRVIRSACEVLSLNSDIILKHSFSRGLFAVSLATNCRAFLKGESEKPKYRNMPMKSLVNNWYHRWLAMRKKNDLLIQKVRGFNPEQFSIEKTSI
jgi:hypothetical protein